MAASTGKSFYTEIAMYTYKDTKTIRNSWTLPECQTVSNRAVSTQLQGDNGEDGIITVSLCTLNSGFSSFKVYKYSMETQPMVPAEYFTGYNNPESTVVKLTEMTDSSFAASVFDQVTGALIIYSISQKPDGSLLT